MIKINELRGLIVSKGLTQKDVAKAIGINEKTFYTKMKRGVFNSDEINRMIKLLDIKDPCELFFN